MRKIELFNYDISQTIFWLNDKRVKIIQVYELFNLCEIFFIDIGKKSIVDILAIDISPNYTRTISIHRLGGDM